MGRVKECLALLRDSRAHDEAGQQSAAGTALWILRLLSAGRFSPRELRAYAPQLPAYRAAIPFLVSKESSLRRLAEINPYPYTRTTDDKALFYRHCDDTGLPSPGLVFSTEEDERFEAWRSLPDGEALAALPDEFIVKDSVGAYGSGFAAYTVRAPGLVDGKGTALSVADLREHLSTGGARVLQPRLFDAEPLARLSGRRSLQTLRVVTYRDDEGDIHRLFYMIKLLSGTNLSDNFSGGQNGNLIAIGEPEQGVLRHAVTGRRDAVGLQRLTEHPDTGEAITGFTIPHWSAACELAVAAHRTLPGLRTLGWDLALTDDGPRLLEGNVRYDPPLYAPELLARDMWFDLFCSDPRKRR